MIMKFMICVVHDHYSHSLANELKAAGYRLTKLMSSGGFLRKGNTTFLIGTNDEDMNDLQNKMKEICLQVEVKKGKLKDGASRYIAFVIDAKESMALLTQLKG